MNPEELKKILENAEMSLDDKLKAIADLHTAEVNGLVLKRDELLASQKTVKTELEVEKARVVEANEKVAELTGELKKTNPAERQKYYDAKIQELTDNHKTELDKVTAEMGKYKEAHISRIRDEAIANGIKDLKLIPAYKEAYIARVLSMNNFELVEIDGNSVFINKVNNKTIDAVMREFSLSAEGKAFIENQNQGGGASGAAGAAGAGGSGNTVTREQFGAMAPAAQIDYLNKGGRVVNPS